MKEHRARLQLLRDRYIALSCGRSLNLSGAARGRHDRARYAAWLELSQFVDAHPYLVANQ